MHLPIINTIVLSFQVHTEAKKKMEYKQGQSTINSRDHSWM